MPLLPTPAVNDMGEGKSVEWWDEWAPRQRSAAGAPAPHGKSLSVELRRSTTSAEAAAMLDEGLFAELDLDAGQVVQPDKLLPTPTAIMRESSPEQVEQRLTTPKYRDSDKLRRPSELYLPEVLAARLPKLLPTPLALHVDRSEEQKVEHRAKRGSANLDDVHTGEFADYQPAVDRWTTILGRPAPAPVEHDERTGREVVSAHFVEWMMGLPDGWVTDVPIGRRAQLKALGNGVCPPQAAAAVARCLNVRASAYAELLDAERAQHIERQEATA